MSSLLNRTDKRTLSDRRKRPNQFISRYFFCGGRRRTIRRQSESSNYYYVDVYSPQLFIVFIILVILCLLDSYFTLVLISYNSVTEANPIMKFYLVIGNETFILVKIAITAASIIILCLYKHYSVTKAVLLSSIIVYVLIILYELQLLYL